jgi:hypothetical protein
VPARLRPAASRRIRSIVRRCDAVGHRPRCLSTTGGGDPRHPLYVAASTPLEPWVPPPTP